MKKVPADVIEELHYFQICYLNAHRKDFELSSDSKPTLESLLDFWKIEVGIAEKGSKRYEMVRTGLKDTKKAKKEYLGG